MKIEKYSDYTKGLLKAYEETALLCRSEITKLSDNRPKEKIKSIETSIKIKVWNSALSSVNRKITNTHKKANENVVHIALKATVRINESSLNMSIEKALNTTT